MGFFETTEALSGALFIAGQLSGRELSLPMWIMTPAELPPIP